MNPISSNKGAQMPQCVLVVVLGLVLLEPATCLALD
jgi:hypothetical protein